MTNANKPHVHSEVIKAWADGAEIEYRHDSTHEWRTSDCPQWRLYTEYRIKPQPAIVKKYTFYDRIEKFVENNDNLNHMTPQIWYDDPSTALLGGMLEWTFTDGELTAINFTKDKQ